MRIGRQRSLEKEDLGKGSYKIHPSRLYEKFDLLWNQEEKKNSKMHFLKCVMKSAGMGRLFFGVFLFMCSELIAFIPTQILNVLVSDLENETLGTS